MFLLHRCIREHLSVQTKGKIERWFRTIRLQFLPILTKNDMQNLASMNRALWLYIEIEYHRTRHRMLKETPLDCWANIGQRVRYPEPGVDLEDLFLFESKRKVQKDRTVSLNGMIYEIDAALVGETVTLRYNPAEQGKCIEVCHNNQFVQEAKLVDTYANCFVKRDRPSSTIEEVGQNKKTPRKEKPTHPVDYIKLTKAEKEAADV